MSSVKNRILQFQQSETNTSTTTTHVPEFCTNGSTSANKPLPPSISLKPSSSTQSKLERNSIEQDQTVTMNNSKSKKTSMTINLSTDIKSGTENLNKPIPSPNRPIRARVPFSFTTSVIPKIASPTSDSKTVLRKETEQLYSSMDWKEKYDESERKRLHIVSLAQKATRDFEELRRRYQDLCSENEKIVQRLNNSTSQLDALRKASEAAYDDYYKLKKHYQAENNAKSQALTRVDEYNKENRRLKRQSAALMQHVTEGGNFNLEQLMETEIGENPENDKEINFLRSRVQELESRQVELESELEKTKLAEFESQEAALLVKDSVQLSMGQTLALTQKIKEIESDNEKLTFEMMERTVEVENLKTKQAFIEEKLKLAEAELRKVQTEKNILQRQSVVFFSNGTLDTQLEDALNQISDLQFQFEEQKLNYETHILELQENLHDKESAIEARNIEVEAQIKSLEIQVNELRKKAKEAEKKLEEIPEASASAPPPPPPPPPMMMTSCPPPPPLPSLNSAIQCVTLRKHKKDNNESTSTNNGTDPKSLIHSSSAQIDDVVSQIKKGIKLRTVNATSRKDSELSGEANRNRPIDSVGVDEMRSILNNLKRTRRAD